MLTDITARRARLPASGRRELRDAKNLFLRLNSAGKRSWMFRYRVGSRAIRVGLGPLEMVDRSPETGMPPQDPQAWALDGASSRDLVQESARACGG